MTDLKSMNCSLARALAEVGDKWSLLIIREAIIGSTRFDEFQQRLGIARNILSSRLVSLTVDGVLERRPSDVSARIFEYHLTSKGRDLFPAVVALLQWGDRWLDAGKGAPVAVVDQKTGRAVRAVLLAGDNRKSLLLDDVTLRPGPGAAPKTQKRLNSRAT
jgi:DNA-binding HxlR family transcriptional regulator